jgi:hypothetical protein
VSPLAERLAELKRHLDHLRALRPRVTGPETLRRDLSLHNDVLFSLLTVCQLVIDISGELAARRGERFEDYASAVRSLAADPRPPQPARARRGVSRNRPYGGRGRAAMMSIPTIGINGGH